MNGGRRKNATRETTLPLKSWLKDHMKNPYPTKAEKVMLGVVTQMNLTQISTWFANARRRLKKENKSEWNSDKSNNSSDEDNTNDEIPANSGAHVKMEPNDAHVKVEPIDAHAKVEHNSAPADEIASGMSYSISKLPETTMPIPSMRRGHEHCKFLCNFIRIISYKYLGHINLRFKN
jgi:hypothetical protein